VLIPKKKPPESIIETVVGKDSCSWKFWGLHEREMCINTAKEPGKKEPGKLRFGQQRGKRDGGQSLE